MEKNDLRIRAVTFDLWETLLFERHGANSERTKVRCRNIAKTLDEFGIRVSSEEVNLAMKKTISSLLTIWEENKDVDHLTQVQLIIKNIADDKVSLNNECVNKLSQAYVAPLFEVPPYLNPDVYEVLQKLRDHRVFIGLICNTGLSPGKVLRDLLADWNVVGFFDFMVFSDEVGIRKPDSGIFHLVAKKLKVQPSECVHVGDNLNSDVDGVKNAGFKAIHFSNDAGRDKLAESDPNSLVSHSRNLGKLERCGEGPDVTIESLKMLTKAIEEIESKSHRSYCCNSDCCS